MQIPRNRPGPYLQVIWYHPAGILSAYMGERKYGSNLFIFNKSGIDSICKTHFEN